MGSLCSRSEPVNLNNPVRSQELVLTSKDNLRISAQTFVQENSKSFKNVYTLHKDPLGSGSFGEVWLCNHNITNELRAVKILLKEGISDEDLANRSVLIEVELIKVLDHPNVLKVFEYFEDDLKYYIVMEYCKGGDLFDKLKVLKTFPEALAAKVMKQLLSALGYVHGQNIIHRDVKLENLLIAEDDSTMDFQVKLIDFNIATIKKAKLDVEGTLEYMAPEVFTGKYDEKCDLWGAGVILYTLMSGVQPFSGADNKEIENNIIKSKPILEKGRWNNISGECKDLISRLLEKKPSLRLTCAQALNHAWILHHTESHIDQISFKSAMNRLSNLGSSSKLKEAFTTFMISQLSRNSSTRKLEQIFNKIDLNKDGVISLAELTEGLKAEMSEEDAQKEAERIMALIDTDGSGFANYSEFLRVSIEDESLLSKENIRKTFAFFDKDGSGSIEKDELIGWLCTGGYMADDIVNSLISEADANNDGSISISEFENLLISKLEIE